jgi:class 3 adenylate cyclase
LSAARVSGLELFRALFPGELLQPGRLISLATITLLVTELPDAASLYEKWGDAGAFARIHEQFRRIEKRASMEGGTLVKTVREGVILSFDDARAAMRTALAIPETLASDPLTADFRPRIGLNRGSAMVATLNSHLDYFGSTVRMAAALPAYANPGGVALPSVLAADPSLAELIIASGRKVDIIHAEIPELGDGFVYRIGLERSSKPTREVASSLRSIAPSGR